MRAQLEHLLDITVRPGLTIQVTPFLTGASYAAPGSFSILSFATDDLPDVVYVEQLTSAMYLDKRADVDRYTEAMDHIRTTSYDAGADERADPHDARGYGGILMSTFSAAPRPAIWQPVGQEQLQRADQGNCVEVAFRAPTAESLCATRGDPDGPRWSSPRPSGTRS